MKLRAAKPADAWDIARVHVLTWQAAYRGIVSDALLDSLTPDKREPMWRESLERGDAEVWVAESPDIVGWIAFGKPRHEDAHDASAEMHALYVHPDYWSQGVGRELWLTARRRLVDRGFERVLLWVLMDNERALGFYRQAGFEPCPDSETTVEIGETKLREIRYETAIGPT